MDKKEYNEKEDNSPQNNYYSKDSKGKILMMRHGETFFNSDPDKTARLTSTKYIDPKLTEKGIEQSKSIQDTLNKLSFETIYISPMYRALQTLSYALENHPDLANIKVVVHPLVNEVTSCVQDYIYDIKKTKNDFNKINSKLNVDWSIFDENVKNIKWDENFYYFDNFDCFEDSKKEEMYLKLKNLYDNNDFDSLKNELANLAKIRYAQKKRFESLKHMQGRFNKFCEFLKEKHKETMDISDKKILIVTHDSFIKCATDRTVYETIDIQKYHPNCYNPKNCEIISLKL